MLFGSIVNNIVFQYIFLFEDILKYIFIFIKFIFDIGILK